METQSNEKNIVMNVNVIQKGHYGGKLHLLFFITNDSRSQQTIKCK